MSMLEGRGGEMVKDSPVIGGASSIKPKTLFHAISEIERWSYTEREAGSLPENIVTQPIYIDFMSIGFANTATTSILMFITLPFSIAVTSRILPIFGTTNPGLMDKFIAFMMSIGPSLITAVFITLLFWNLFMGKATKKAVNSLVIQGIVIPKIFFTFVACFLYIGIAEVFLNSKYCMSIVQSLHYFFGARIPPEKIFYFLYEVKHVLIEASLTYALISALKIVILLIGYLRADWKTKKFIKLYTKYFPDKDKYLEAA